LLKISTRSGALLILGTLVLLLSAIAFLWAVPLENASFRPTGKADQLTLQTNSVYDLSLDPSAFGVTYDAGERLAIKFTASMATSVIIHYQLTGETIVILYPTTQVRMTGGQITLSHEPNTPTTITLDKPGPALVRFSNSENNPLYVSYEVIISYKTVNITYPYRESNGYLILGLLGTGLLLAGLYLAATEKRVPAHSAKPKRTRMGLYCISCGAKLAANSKFCSNCGETTHNER